MRVQPFQGNVVYDLGLGVFRWADVILGGLDNREARVAINQAAARMGGSGSTAPSSASKGSRGFSIRRWALL